MHDAIDRRALPVSDDRFVPLAQPIPLLAGAAATPVFLPALPEDGSYQITLTPPSSPMMEYRGTLRVDSSAGALTISGDLYSVATSTRRPGPQQIPVYPRANYHSYLKVTAITPVPSAGSLGSPGILLLTAEEYVYTQPAPGTLNGTFSSTPSRVLTIQLVSQLLPPGAKLGTFAGTVALGAQGQGSFSMLRCSAMFRSAVLIVHTLAGAAAPPMAVPGTGGTESFASVFETAGWNLFAIPASDPLATPPGVNPNDCWSDPDLFTLLGSVVVPADLDLEWRYHLLVVPGTLKPVPNNCGRGKVLDVLAGPTTGSLAPRQGSVSYSDDGYPSNETNYGGVANKKQRDVPRAFLRSACHEVGHGFNQVHQENEGGADNSIMTTTPSVAGVLESEGGVFPDGINLGFNAHVRRHLVHFPDPVVRPGGMTFGQGHISPVPQADQGREFLVPSALELQLTAESNRIKLGQPLRLSWQLVNQGQQPIRLPSDIRPEALHARITVFSPLHPPRRMPSLVIQTDRVVLRELAPKAMLRASTTVFWGSNGFAFVTPGKHWVHVMIVWSDQGTRIGVEAETEVWVDHPTSEADNEVAANLLHHEVGMIVALGGMTPYLQEGMARIKAAAAQQPQHPACKHLTGLTRPG
jgi:hypothetical protein